MEWEHKRPISRRAVVAFISFASLIFLFYVWQRGSSYRRPQNGPDLYLGKWRRLPETSLLCQDTTQWASPCNPLITTLQALPSPPAQSCNVNGGHEAPFIVVGVMSTAQSRWRRDLYRSTMPVDGVNVVRFFVLGEAEDSQSMADLQLESELYGDILLLRGVRAVNPPFLYYADFQFSDEGEWRRWKIVLLFPCSRRTFQGQGSTALRRVCLSYAVIFMPVIYAQAGRQTMM
jgi:hypothetical protein